MALYDADKCGPGQLLAPGAALLSRGSFRQGEQGERGGVRVTHPLVPGTVLDPGQTLPAHTSPRPSPHCTDDETEAQRGKVLARVNTNWSVSPELPGSKVCRAVPLAWRLSSVSPAGPGTLGCVPLRIPAGHLWLQGFSLAVTAPPQCQQPPGWSPVPRGVRGNEAP